MEDFDPYRILQVPHSAEHADIRDSYRRLARRFHPDHSANASDTVRMIEVNQAWWLLGDPTRRIEYDRAHGIVTPTGSEPAPSIRRSTAGGGAAVEREDGGTTLRRGAAATLGARMPVGPSGGATLTRSRGNSANSVLTFGRYSGWTIDQVAHHDREYLEWLSRTPTGRPYRSEITRVIGPSRGTEPAASSSTKQSSRRIGR